MRRNTQLIFDLVIIIFLLGSFYWGLRRGLLRSLADLVIILIAMATSFILVRPWSSWLLQQGFLAGKMQVLTQKIQVLATDNNGMITDVLTKLGLPNVWIRYITDQAGGENQSWIENIAQSLTKLAVAVLVFLILFTIINVILKLLTRNLTKMLDNIYLVGFLNRMGGGFINLALGLIIVVFLLLLISALTPWIPSFGTWQENSRIASFLREKNYFLSLLETIF